MYDEMTVVSYVCGDVSALSPQGHHSPHLTRRRDTSPGGDTPGWASFQPWMNRQVLPPGDRCSAVSVLGVSAYLGLAAGDLHHPAHLSLDVLTARLGHCLQVVMSVNIPNCVC